VSVEGMIKKGEKERKRREKEMKKEMNYLHAFNGSSVLPNSCYGTFCTQSMRIYSP
jgi:hypothetical protein